MDDELADVDAGEARAQEPPEQRQRERDERDDLPPEQVLVGEWAVDEREDALEDRAQRDGDCGEQERREDAARSRRGAARAGGRSAR